MKGRYAVKQKASSKSGGLLPQVTKGKDCKSDCRKPKKAQLVFEFIVAMLIFFGIIIYALNYLSWTVAGYSGDSSAASMESETMQIGELLVLNEGNWSGGVPITVGLRQEWPVLNSTKISWMNTSCNNDYDNFMKTLDLPPKHMLKVTITETLPSGAVSVMADCRWGMSMPGNAAKAETRRYALAESGNILTVYVGVWTTGK